MREGPVVVVGSAVVDFTYRVETLPLPGETARALDFRLGLGGKGANQAAAARLLGASVVFVGRVGDDPLGEAIRKDLAGFRIEARVEVAEGVPTAQAAVLVSAEGENLIAVFGGANERVTPRDVDLCGDAIRGASLLVAQMEIPVEATRRAAEIARSAAVPTMLNAAPAHRETRALLGLFDHVVLNRREAEDLTEVGVSTVDDAMAALRAVRALGVDEPVITLGAAGAVYVERGHAVHVESPRVEAVDATGAGDAFVGALAAFLREGQEMRDAVPAACRYAALSTTRPGTRSSYATRAEFEAFE